MSLQAEPTSGCVVGLQGRVQECRCDFASEAEGCRKAPLWAGMGTRQHYAAVSEPEVENPNPCHRTEALHTEAKHAVLEDTPKEQSLCSCQAKVQPLPQ